MKIILAYSAKNNRANPPLPYSILNPETNSDSPSAKSKGVRLVSAIIEATHISSKGNANTTKFTPLCASMNFVKFSLPTNKAKDKNKKAKATSYEIV